MNYQVMPDLTPEEYEELKADVAERGVMVPVELDENGDVLDGHHRLRACRELGITEYPTIVREGMTEEQKRTHARKLNMLRRQLTREQKQELIKQQLRETPERSDRQIAGDLGIDHKTVSSRRSELEGRGEIPHVGTVTDTLGRVQPRQADRKPPKPANDPEPIPEQVDEHELLPVPEPSPEPEPVPENVVNFESFQQKQIDREHKIYDVMIDAMYTPLTYETRDIVNAMLRATNEMPPETIADNIEQIDRAISKLREVNTLLRVEVKKRGLYQQG